MYSIWQRHKRKFILLLLALFPIVMIAGWGDARLGHDTNMASSAVRQAMRWGNYAGSQLAGGLLDVSTGWVDSELEEENDDLKRENARLKEEKSRLIGVLQENERLRQMVGLKTRRPEFNLVPARVISRDTSPYFRVVNIRIQSDVELKPRMPVIVAEGVVGQVHEVTGKFAEVIILSDPRHRVDAISQRTRAQAIVAGLGHERDYNARLSYLSEMDQVREGDIIVTSGMGGVFPKELIIGTVSTIEKSERGLFQEATLTPAVDFSRLEEVFVLTEATR